jgi:hypothetical protein
MTETQLGGLVQTSVQHEMAQEFKFRRLIGLYDSATLKDRMVHTQEVLRISRCQCTGSGAATLFALPYGRLWEISIND